ncbi:MAG: cation transporter [Hyphomicrobiaceae bacterium]
MGLRRTVALVAALNLAYFGVEATVAALIQSVSLFADSVDFLEDAAVNVLVLVGLGLAAGWRRLIALVLAALMVIPGVAALLTAAGKLLDSAAIVPEPMLLTATGLGALAVNSVAALMLARVRDRGGSLTRAAFLSARNDVLANIAIIAAGLITALRPSIWPDLIVGLAIAAINITAAWEVYGAAMGEGDDDDVSAIRP